MLQIRNDYNALAYLQGASYRAMEPRFSYWAVVGIILWCMNNIDNPAPLQPPDTQEVLSGMAADLLPSLYINSFMSLYENVLKYFLPCSDDEDKIKHCTEKFEKDYKLGNRYFSGEVRRLFAPLLDTIDGPVPEWLMRAITL